MQAGGREWCLAPQLPCDGPRPGPARAPCPVCAAQDFRTRIAKYEAVYETIMDRTLHYIKLIDMVTGGWVAGCPTWPMQGGKRSGVGGLLSCSPSQCPGKRVPMPNGVRGSGPVAHLLGGSLSPPPLPPSRPWLHGRQPHLRIHSRQAGLLPHAGVCLGRQVCVEGCRCRAGLCWHGQARAGLGSASSPRGLRVVATEAPSSCWCRPAQVCKAGVTRPRKIWLTRHGQSQFNVEDKIGGNSGLSPRWVGGGGAEPKMGGWLVPHLRAAPHPPPPCCRLQG